MSFKLNQVEGALNALLSGPSHTAIHRLIDKPPLRFRNRIKRLLNIDRAQQEEARKHRGNNIDLAFFDHAPGSGNDRSYDLFSVFCLAVALELLAFGFPQEEVVNKISAIRTRLRGHFKEIIAHVQSWGPVTETTRSEGEAPETHRYLTVYLDYKLNGWQPDVCNNWSDLQRHLEATFRSESRSAFLIDLTQIAAHLSGLLSHVPERRRGRPVGGVLQSL